MSYVPPMSNVAPQTRSALKALGAAFEVSSELDPVMTLMQKIQRGQSISFGKKDTDFYVELVQDPKSSKGKPSFILKGHTGPSSIDKLNVAVAIGGIAQTQDPFAFAKLERLAKKITQDHAHKLADKAEAERIALENAVEQQRQERQKTLSTLINECREQLGLSSPSPSVDLNEHNIKMLALESYQRGTKLAFTGLTAEGKPIMLTYASETAQGIQQILTTETSVSMSALGREAPLTEDLYLTLDALKGTKITGLGDGTHPVVSAQHMPKAQSTTPSRSLKALPQP